MATPGAPVNADPRKTQLPIRFGDVIEVTERDGTKTQWRLDLNGGEPILRPANLPTRPGVYSVGPEHADLFRFRQLVLTAHGEWFWLDVTSTGRDGTWVPVTESEVSGLGELTSQYVATRDEMARAGR